MKFSKKSRTGKTKGPNLHLNGFSNREKKSVRGLTNVNLTVDTDRNQANPTLSELLVICNCHEECRRFLELLNTDDLNESSRRDEDCLFGPINDRPSICDWYPEKDPDYKSTKFFTEFSKKCEEDNW